MNKKIFRSFALLIVVTVIAFSFAACSTGNSMDGVGYLEEKSPGSHSENGSGIITDTVTVDAVGSDCKIIENMALTVQTKEFDTLLENINEQMEALGGYVESSDISGREIDSYNNRTAKMKIRIPAQHSDAFSSYISEHSVVVNRSITTEDVTLSYVDIESRLAALQAEKESLETLLEKAASVEDIISIRNKLTEVIADIESYTSQLRTYDNLIDYCTVEIAIYEVERTVVAEEQNIWQEIGANLSHNFANVWNGIVDVFVFALSSIPYLIPGAVVVVIVLVVFAVRKKLRKNKAAETQDSEGK